MKDEKLSAYPGIFIKKSLQERRHERQISQERPSNTWLTINDMGSVQNLKQWQRPMRNVRDYKSTSSVKDLIHSPKSDAIRKANSPQASKTLPKSLIRTLKVSSNARSGLLLPLGRNITGLPTDKYAQLNIPFEHRKLSLKNH